MSYFTLATLIMTRQDTFTSIQNSAWGLRRYIEYHPFGCQSLCVVKFDQVRIFQYSTIVYLCLQWFCLLPSHYYSLWYYTNLVMQSPQLPWICSYPWLFSTVLFSCNLPQSIVWTLSALQYLRLTKLQGVPWLVWQVIPPFFSDICWRWRSRLSLSWVNPIRHSSHPLHLWRQCLFCSRSGCDLCVTVKFIYHGIVEMDENVEEWDAELLREGHFSVNYSVLKIL